MEFLNMLTGIDSKISSAESLYKKGLYEEALEMLELNKINGLLISKDRFIKIMYLCAECQFQLHEYDSALRFLNLIIDDPECNNNYMSKAESLKKRILSTINS